MTRARRVCLALLLAALSLQTALAAPSTLHVGVLAIDETDVQKSREAALDEYLTRTLGDTEVEVRHYGFEEMQRAILGRTVDLALTSSTDYVAYAHRIGLSAPVATVVLYHEGRPLAGFGGAILALGSREDLRTPEDLVGRRIGIVDRRSLGGFQSQAFELLKRGIDVTRVTTLVPTGTPESSSLHALLERRVDAIFVRAGALEAWQKRGLVQADELKVIGRRSLSNYPFALSTTLYPYYPVVAMPQLDPVLARRVVAALLAMPDGTLAARGEAVSFMLPADYEPVRNLARTLRMPPYDQEAPVTLRQIWDDHGWWVVAIGVCALLALILLGLLAHYAARITRVAAQLGASEERFRRLFADSRLPTLLLKDGRVIDVNRACIEFLGAGGPADLIGRSPVEFSPELQADGVSSRVKSQEMLAIARRQGAHAFEWDHERLDGGIRTVQVLVTMIDVGGEQIFHGVFTDVTAARRDEAELRRYRERLEELVAQRTAELEAANAQIRINEQRHALAIEASNDVVWEWAVGSRTAFCSPAYYRMLGYTEAELGDSVDAILFDRLHPDERTEFLARCAQALRDRHLEAEFRLRARDGSYRWVFTRAKMIEFDAAGRSVRAAGILTDLTARKEMELALREAKEQAEAANVAKSNFLANMSHEIRTPMNAILGFAQLLQFELQGDEQRAKLLRMDQAAHHLLAIIDDILDLSKIEAGRLSIDTSEVDIAALLQETHDMLSQRAASRGLWLRLEVDDALDDLTLCGDRLRLRQILVNLIGNAIKFTDAGGVTVRAAVDGPIGETVTLRFDVEDTGIGVQPEQRSRLFQPFEQAQSSNTRAYGGTGLGLAISRRLAQLMGGDCWLASVGSGGSVFAFTVRLQRDVGARAVAPASETPAVGALPAPRPGARLLLAEDNEVNQAVARAMLKRLGLEVDVVGNGAEAVEKAASTRYDLVLMDLQMPVLDGFDATRRIRALPQGAAVPIVAMTASAFAEDRQRCLEAGMNGHVAKPVEMERLRAALAEWLPD
jgi:PAS domain S-box-containing protein